MYQYAPNGLTWIDPWGLTSTDEPGYFVYALYDQGAREPCYIDITNDIDIDRRTIEHRETGRLSASGRMKVLEKILYMGTQEVMNNSILKRMERKLVK